MKLSAVVPAILLLLGDLSCCCDAYQIHQNVKKNTPLQNKSNNKKHAFAPRSLLESTTSNLWQDFSKLGATALTAATILVSSASVPDNAFAATPSLELSKGAIVIESTGSSKSGGLLKAEIDSQSLLKTIFQNRKELTVSLQNVQSSIQQELSKQVWKDVQMELLDIEGDVVPELKIRAPSSLKTTLQDISKGKLELLVNGEIVNIQVEPTFGKEEDDLVIRVTGFKGEQFDLPAAPAAPTNTSPRTGPIRSYLTQFDDFWAFWNEPYPSKYLLDGLQATNGQIILAGSAGAVGMVYLLSYMYYVQLNEQEEQEAAAKKAAIAEKKKKKKQKEEKEKQALEAKAAKEDNKAKKKKADAKKEAKSQESKVTDGYLKASASSEAQDTKKRRRRFRFWKQD